jgi:hypothetical protein
MNIEIKRKGSCCQLVLETHDRASTLNGVEFDPADVSFPEALLVLIYPDCINPQALPQYKQESFMPFTFSCDEAGDAQCVVDIPDVMKWLQVRWAAMEARESTRH